MKSFKKIGLLLLIICFLLFIASLYFLIAGINNIHNNQTIGIEYIGIAFSGFVAFGTILLVLATFYTLFESKRKDEKIEKQLYDQYRERHLDEIRNTSLSPILGKINDTYYQNAPFFEIKENQGLDEEFLQQDFDRPRHSYDKEIIFDYNYKEIVNNNLYKDLQNHKITIGIPDDFNNVLDLIMKNYPKYLKNLIELIKRIKLSDKFNELENRLKLNPNYKDIFYLKKIKDDYIKLIVLITLDYLNLKYLFPNSYDLAYNDKEYENIEEIGAILRNSEEVKIMKTAKYEVKEKVEKLANKIKEILKDNTLVLDECDYLKGIRNVM